MKNIRTKLAYENLANAIIVQAADDYRKALRALKSGHATARGVGNAEAIIHECERFFKSSYFELLTTVNGPGLMKQLKKEVYGNDIQRI